LGKKREELKEKEKKNKNRGEGGGEAKITCDVVGPSTYAKPVRSARKGKVRKGKKEEKRGKGHLSRDYPFINLSQVFSLGKEKSPERKKKKERKTQIIPHHHFSGCV